MAERASTHDTAAGGNVPESLILDQVSALNSNFSETGLGFTLAEVIHTMTMKQSLHQGVVAALNVYIVGFNSAANQGLLGYATFPSSYSSNPGDDGVVMRFMTLPEGSQTSYNGGQVLTHEIGHWGRTRSGDMVADTPAEAEPASGCPEGRDTCSSPRIDPIHNYMNYAYNSCMEEFTPDQTTPLKDQVATYRGL
ncbi:hypothetical protein ACEPAH_4281 [Sanghuangporus vaninii]